MKQFVTSLNDDIFNGEQFETEDEAIDYMVNDLPKGDDFYIGVPRKVEIGNLFNISQLIDAIQENAYDEVGDVAEDYLSDCNYKKQQELEKIICDWFKKNNFEPTFYAVDDIKHYLILDDKKVKRLD